jgi:aryl-alcohol dehydrogenase-like predicted oxidoreductase
MFVKHIQEGAMELRTLGKSDIKISPIIMGTWQAGKEMWTGIDDAETTKGIRAAFEAGITIFDSAEAYGKGHSERILGNALKDVREQVVYATKVFPNHLKYDQVIESCKRSLENLQTDHIDLYQIHWPSGSFGTEVVPIEESMRALNELKTQGKIRAIGVSNFSRAQFEEAASYGRIDSLQPPYSLFWRQLESDAMPYCVENSITILAYSSMAQGLLTGKFGPDQQLALAWVIAQPMACAIAGARNADQVVQNAIAAEIQLSADELSEMDTIGRTVTDHLDDNPVMWDF